MRMNELNCIYSSLWNAKDVVQNLANPNYPYAEFSDVRLREMFYDLNTMCMTIRKMMDEQEGA